MALSPKLQDSLDRLVGYVVLRTQEAATWRGIALLFSAGGSVAKPEHAQGIIATGMVVSGLIGVLFPSVIKKAQDAGAGDLGKVTVDLKAAKPDNPDA